MCRRGDGASRGPGVGLAIVTGAILGLQPGFLVWRLLYDQSIRTFTDNSGSVSFALDGAAGVLPDWCFISKITIISAGAELGVEVQGDWANLRASIPSIAFPGATDFSKVTRVGLFTGQIGYAWNAALLYLKGGGAWANNNFSVVSAGGVGIVNASSNRLGASVGVGFEYLFTPNWSAGIEYDHLMMGNANNSFSCSAICATAANTISQNIDMVTVRVNYKFGGPVVARY